MKLSLKLGSVMGSLFIAVSTTFLFGQGPVKGSGLENNQIIHKSTVGPNGFVRCHTMEADSIRRSLDPTLPSLWEEEMWLQNKIQEYKAEEAAKAASGQPKATLLTLPIVFHVITSGSGATNINAVWVQRQVDQLNIDYRNLAGSTNAAAADVEIQFCLAVVDPSGNVLTEPGIHRVTSYGAGPFTQTTMDNTVKPGTIWNPNNYINIWTADLSGGLLGYAQFPSNSGLSGLNTNGGSANTDGVVILHTSLGSVANPNPAGGVYGRGRTLSHELGHWLGLRHIWGDGACNVDDFCADTPAAAAANYGCPTGTNSCTGGSYPGNDMIENYMDYTDDACMNIFTADQKTRIRAVLNVATRRSTLAASTACNLPSSDDSGISAIVTPNGEICQTTFTPVVTLKNYGGNVLTSCQIKYNIDGGANSTFNWTGSLASFATINVTLPSVTTTVGSHTFNSFTLLPNGVTDASSGNDASSASFTVNLTAGSAIPVSEGFASTTFAPTNWTINNGGNALTWVRVTNAGIAPTAGNAARMDNYSTNIAGDVDDLVMFPVDLTGYSSVTLTFDVAHARYNSSYIDRLDVVVWGCGLPETQVYSKSGSTLATVADQTTAFTPTAAQWRNETVDLSPYIGNNKVYIGFRNISGYGNNTYLDNINLSGVVAAVPPVANYTASQSTICSGSTVNFTDASTGSPTTYSWSFPGGTPSTSTSANPSIVYNTAGTYNVSLTVTNGAGSDTQTYNNMITVNATPSTPVVSVTNGCGTSTLTTSGSNLSWSTGASTTSITVSSAGTYTVTQTSNGCTSSAGTGVAAPIAIPSAPTTTVTNGCGTSTISATGSNLSWSTGATTPSITVSSAGTYTVTQTVSGCTSNASSATAAPVAIPSAPTTSVTNGCGTSTISATGSNLSWSTGATTPSITVSSAGTYTVTQTVSGCTSAASSATAAPTVVPSAPATTVTNGCGTSTISATGSNLSWSTGATTPSITVSSAGTYTVTQTISGCTSAAASAAAAPVAIPSAPTTTVTNGCGTSTISATGSNLSWSTGATTPSITVSSAGTYTVTQTVSGCTSTSASATAAPNAVPSITTNGSSNPSSCAVNDGTISVSGSGTGTLSWSGAMSGSSSVTLPYTISGLDAGAYSIVFNNGCSSNTLSISLVDPSAPSAPTVSSVNSCGSSVLTATGSNLLWSTGETTPSISVTSGGSYTVTQTVSGCTSASSTVTAAPVNVPSAPAASIVDGCNASTLTATGSNLLWSTGETTPSINVTSAGTYTVTQTVNGCTSSPSSVVAAPNAIPSAPVATVQNNCGSSVLTATGSNLEWSTGETTSNITVSAGGDYTVTQTVNGCTSSATTLTANPTAVPAIPSVSVSNGCGTSTLSATGTNLNWSTGQSTPSIVVSNAGSYTVTQTVGGCTSGAATIQAAPNMVPAVPVITVQDNCGTSLLTATGSNLVWSTGETTSSITVTSAGTYTVNQTSNGCTSADATATAAPQSGTTITLGTVNDPSTCGGSDGTITVQGNGSGTITWSGAASGTATGTMPYTITGLGAGAYSIEFDNGCQSNVLSATINSGSVPSAPVVSVQDLCGYSILTTSGTGLQWSTGETASSITVTTGGDFYVSQTVSGCTSATGMGTAAPLVIPNVSLDPIADVCINTEPFQLSGGSPAGGDYFGTGVSNNIFDPSVSGYGTFLITYTYTDGNTCSRSAQQTITVGCAGIDEEEISYAIYPNPSNGEVTIAVKGIELKTVNVYDAAGRFVKQYELNTIQETVTLNLSDLASGTYAIDMITEQKVLRERLIINH
ncbi:MAG: PKD domain-containing protein [Bacteroidetes bacterium]|nr:MAG: PKD domain-containing protein [Bacteroidota bacterium]